MPVYEKRSTVRVPVRAALDFFSDPAAFGLLVPPGLIARVRRDTRTSLTEGELEFTLWFGPVPVRWLARHEPGPTAHSFADVMVRGPLQTWRHEHIFETVEGGTRMMDRVTFTHKPGLPGVFTRLVFDGLPLRFLFAYRHWRTARALRTP